MENETVGELIKKLREQLVPGGTAPIVKLHLEGYGYFSHADVVKAIDRLEYAMTIGHALGEKLNPLESMGAQLLLDSIYHNWDKK